MSQDIQAVNTGLQNARSEALAASSAIGDFGVSLGKAQNAMQSFSNASGTIGRVTASLQVLGAASKVLTAEQAALKKVTTLIEKVTGRKISVIKEDIKATLANKKATIARKKATTASTIETKRQVAADNLSAAATAKTNAVDAKRIAVQKKVAVATATATKANTTAATSTNILTKARTALSATSLKATANKIKETAATKKQIAADKIKTKGLKLQTGLIKAQTTLIKATTGAKLKDVIATKAKNAVKTIAAVVTKVFNAVLAMNPILLIVAAIAALIAVGARLISWFSRANREARAHAREVSDLADTYGISTETIEEDMERMGNTCTEVWQTVNTAAQESASRFGGCADEIRGEIADLVYYYECYEQAIASWEATQMEALESTAAQWGVTAGEIYAYLGEITLDEWVEQQEAHLNELSDIWHMSSSDIQRELEEQGVSMEQWEAQQSDMVHSLAEEWGMSADEIKGYMNEMGMSASEMAVHMGQAWDDFNADVSRNVDSIINGFREIPTEYEQSAEDLRAIMEANIATTEAWRESMGEIASEVSPEMLAWLESKGPEFNSVIGEMLDCADELDAWVDAFDRTTALATDEALSNIDDPAIHNAIVSRLDETGQAVASSTVLGDSYETAINNATDRAVNIATQGGREIGDSFVESATNVDYAAIPNTISQTISAGQASMVQPMQQAVTAMTNTVQSGMTAIQTTTTGAFTGLGKQTNVAMTSMATIIQAKLARVKLLFNQLSTNVQTSSNQVVTTINNMATHTQAKLARVKLLFNQLSTKIQTSSNQATNAVNNMSTGMVRAMNGIDTRFRNIGHNMIDGLRSGIMSREAALMATVNRIASNMQRTLQRALQINSPSRIMKEKIGRFIPEGIGAGITKYADAAIGSVDQLAKDMINIKLPSVESMIGIGPNISTLATVSNVGANSNDNSITNNYEGMFKGATFSVNNDQDVDRIMQLMARKIRQDRMSLKRRY